MPSSMGRFFRFVANLRIKAALSNLKVDHRALPQHERHVVCIARRSAARGDHPLLVFKGQPTQRRLSRPF